MQQSLISCDPPLFAGGLTPTSMLSKDPPATTNHARDAKTPGQDGPIRCLTVDSISDAAARAAPSVVNITVTYSGPAGELAHGLQSLNSHLGASHQHAPAATTAPALFDVAPFHSVRDRWQVGSHTDDVYA